MHNEDMHSALLKRFTIHDLRSMILVLFLILASLILNPSVVFAQEAEPQPDPTEPPSVSCSAGQTQVCRTEDGRANGHRYCVEATGNFGSCVAEVCVGTGQPPTTPGDASSCPAITGAAKPKCDPYKEICDVTTEIFKAPEYAGYTLENLLGNGFACILGPISLRGNCTFQIGGKTKVSAFNPNGGALGAATKSLAMVYTNQPLSGTQYLAGLMQNKFGIGPEPAYAQVTGTGSLVIQPVQKIWQISRNFAYLMYIFIFIYIGFAIMFRQKMGQAALTAQSALPGIIVSLLLVTFSYFIAGFLVDFAFWGSQFIGVLLYTQLAGFSAPDATNRVQGLLNNNLMGLTWSIMVNGDAWGVTREQVSSAVTGAFGQVGTRAGLTLAGALAGCFNPITGAITTVAPIVGTAAACGIGATVGGIAGAFGPEVISIVAYLVLLIGLLQAMFRLFFQLLGSYVSIIVATITGPLVLMTSAIPGRGKAAEGWIKGILANALVFPAVFAAMLLAAALLNIGDPWNLSSTIDPFTQGLPLFGNLEIGFINLLLAYGILFMTPTIPAQVKGFLGVKDNNQAQQAVIGGITQGIGGFNMLRGQVGGGFNKALRIYTGRFPQNQDGWRSRLKTYISQEDAKKAAAQKKS